ncbi:MAG: HU family DNA-binding protein [Phycisphaerales bacterium]
MAKKKTTKKTTKKAPAKKTTTANARFPKAEKPRTKSEVYGLIAEKTDLSKKEVSNVFDTMQSLIANDLKKSGPQIFTVPGLMKITVQRKPATKARKGVNPFTGEEMMFKAKPARNVVKVRPLKNLKEMV